MTIGTFEAPGGVSLGYRLDDFVEPGRDVPTVVLAHGFTRNSNMWYAWVPELAKDFRVIRLDLRGHGLSSGPVGDFASPIDTLVLDALALLSHRNISEAIWIGEATGAIMGVALGARLPDRLHSLIVMTLPLVTNASNTAAVLESGLDEGETVLGHTGDAYMLSHGMRAWAERSVRGRPWPREASEIYREWWIDQISKNDPTYCYDFHRPMEHLDLRQSLKELNVPTLYLDGNRDSIVTDDDRAVLRENNDVKVVRLDGPGIDIGYARPQECIAEIRKFLDQ